VSPLRLLVLAAALTMVLPGAGSRAAQDDDTEPCAEAAAPADATPGASPAASPAATADASPAASPETAAAAEECTVDIRDLAFEPADIEIAIGTTVTWTNNDTVPHTATASDGSFDSGVFDPGASFSYTFDEAGMFDYSCLIHPEMQGSVVVR
jgi:plastocyanin